MMRIGIDLGGTKIEGVALGASGAVLAGKRTPTPRHDYDAMVRTVAGLVEAPALVEAMGP
ncbi:MAG TPA: ROK family protein [Vicinamibacterales bacterium]|nr:ROK family protein [Vicinamibacterales bacterium]